MRRIEASVAVALAFSLALLEPACALTGKAKPSSVASTPPPPKPAAAPKAAAPPEPLSVPQTQVQLPPAQPVDPDALAQPPPKPEEPAAAPAASRSPRHVAPAQPKPAENPAPTPPPVAAAPAEELPPVQEVLSPEDRRRLQESADSRRAEIRQLLSQIKGHRLTAEQNRDVKRIQSLVEQAENAEKRGDVRQADALAERALILAQEMTGGK